MSRVQGIRELLHRPYLRAAIVGVTLATAGATSGIVALELRYRVPAGAVVRYFARIHSNPNDLTQLLRRSHTQAALAGLSHTSTGMNSGGLVYSHEGRLHFHPWMPEGAAAAAKRGAENEAIYTRLLASYIAAELDGLVEKLSHPEVRRSLGEEGLSPRAVGELQRRVAAAPDSAERLRLLRRAAAFIRPFVPTRSERHQLGLADKLRFYENGAPRGRYVGLYEVRGPTLLGPTPPSAIPSSGRLLTITKELNGGILVEDLRPQGRRVYRLTPVHHPAGLPRYRLGSRA
jgi:hypothetical protein